MTQARMTHETPITSDGASLWLRQDGESAKAYEAFQAYLNLGSARSLNTAYRQSRGLQEGVKGATSGRWVRWCGRHRWVMRAKAFDMANADLADDARQEALAKKAAEWERRRAAQREKDYALGTELQAKARKLLNQLGQADARPVRAGDLARMAEAGSKLARLAAGMETDSTKIALTGGISVDIDLSDKTDDELNSYLADLAKAAAVLTELSPIDQPAPTPALSRVFATADEAHVPESAHI